MTRPGLATVILALVTALGGCTHAEAPPVAASLTVPQPTGDPLQDSLALLVAADAADNPQARAPMIERLNALNVTVAGDGGDDPLSAWRGEHIADGGTPWRGRTLGPAYRRARIGPGESLTIEQVFYAGERAEIAAQASANGPVALQISNPRNEAVCQKQLSPAANCQWLPIFTERFSISLENRNSQPASVYIVFR